MAFDITQSFGRPVINRLLNPHADAPQNFLTNPQAALQQFSPAQQMTQPSQPPAAQDQPKSDPWAGLRNVTVDPAQAGSTSGQHPAQFVDHRSTRDKLFDMFSGWASGNSIGQSLALGAQGYRGQNQTVKYLMNNGYDQSSAEFITKTPQALNLALSNIFRKGDPKTAMELQKAGLDIQKEQRELNEPQLISAGNGSFYNKGTGEWITPPGGSLRDTPDIQNFKFAKENGYTGGFSDFITEKSRAIHSTGTVGGNTIDFDDLPMVTLGEDGAPDQQQQQAFLAKLPRELAEQVRGISEGRLPIDKVTSMKAGERQQMAKLVSMSDPTFDMSNAPTRAATRKDYATGEMAKLAASTNMAIQHLGGMMDAAEKLNNSRFPLWNSIKNLYGSETGDPDIKSFETYRLGVADELGKAFHGTGAVPEAQINAWKNDISTSSSPEQLLNVVHSAMQMLASRTQTYNSRYKNVMGRDAPDFLEQKSYEVLQRMGIDPSEVGARNRTQDGPKVGAVEDGHRFRGGDPSDPKNWEKV